MATKRSWAAMREKVDSENRCRVCAIPGSVKPLEAAHIIQRSRVPAGMGGEHPDNCVPLCHHCHAEYDQGTLDLLPFLSCEERVKAVELSRGDLIGALQRLTNRRWVPAL